MTLDTLAHWHNLVETRNTDELNALLADNVVSTPLSCTRRRPRCVPAAKNACAG